MSAGKIKHVRDLCFRRTRINGGLYLDKQQQLMKSSFHKIGAKKAVGVIYIEPLIIMSVRQQLCVFASVQERNLEPRHEIRRQHTFERQQENQNREPEQREPSCHRHYSVLHLFDHETGHSIFNLCSFTRSSSETDFGEMATPLLSLIEAIKDRFVYAGAQGCDAFVIMPACKVYVIKHITDNVPDAICTSGAHDDIGEHNKGWTFNQHFVKPDVIQFNLTLIQYIPIQHDRYVRSRYIFV